MKDSTPKTSNTEKTQIGMWCLGILLFLVLLTAGTGYILYESLRCGCSESSIRENRAKSTLGAVNRAQMSYYDKNKQFAQTFEELEFPISYGEKQYYIFRLLPEKGIAVAYGINNEKNGTKDYIGGINFNVDTQEFNTIVCRMNKRENNQIVHTISNPYTAITNYGEVSDENSEIQCNEGGEVR